MSEEQVKYSSYTPAQKKASQVYRMKNKDKINEQRKKYYQARKASDPMFLEYKRKKAKEYYEKKKLEKATGIVATELKTSIKEIKEALEEEKKREAPVSESPAILEVKTDEKQPEKVEEEKKEKPKRTRKVKKLIIDTTKAIVEQVKPDVVVEDVKPKKSRKSKSPKSKSPK